MSKMFRRMQVCLLICTCLRENHSHTCRVEDGIANCSKRELIAVPTDLPKDIKSLDLEKNFIRNISRDAFSRYCLLNKLNLNWNNISYLGDDTFVGLKELTELSIRNNHLNLSSSFGMDVFSPLTALKILDISDNMINPGIEIIYPYFGDLQNVVEMKIDLVPIPNFEKSDFKKMKNLKKLDFVNCRLKQLKSKTFSGVTAPITNLSITGCTVMSIVEANALSSFSFLSTLILSQCCLELEQAFKLLYPFKGKTMERIEFLDVNKGFCNRSIIKPFAVILTSKMMQNLHNICLRHLTLKQNGIVDFEPNSFLFSNYPECFSSISILDNYFYLINGFKANELMILFTKLTNLTTLNFSGKEKSVPIVSTKSKTTQIENTIPFPPKLKRVTLSSLDVGVVPNKLTFSNVSSLEYVDMSYYKIANFPEISFTGKNKIAYIDISGIPSSLYADRIGMRLFENAKKVVINNAWLSKTIRGGKNIFSLFPSIENLNISNNLLWKIPKGFFLSNVNLTNLDIRRNLLREIPLSVMELPRLTHLTLQNNVIQTINSTLRDFFDRQQENMKTFHLHLVGNVFRCTCENRGFIRWLFKTKVQFDGRDYYKCLLSNGTVLKVKEVYREYSEIFGDCDATVWLRVGIILLVTFVTLSIPIALIVNFRWRMGLWIFRFFKRTIEKEISSFKYDVYLSCAEDSVPWANDILIPKMQESWGLKVFFEERDIVPGNVQLDGISEGIAKSRNILFIVSEQFRQRQWSAFEIRYAMYEKFCRTLQRIVVITRDIDVNEFPVQLGHIVRDIYIINWIDDESERNLDKLKTLVDNDVNNIK